MSFLQFKSFPQPLQKVLKSANKPNEERRGSMRKAFSDWLIRNYGENYQEEISRQRNLKMPKQLKGDLVAATPESHTDEPVVGIVGGGFAGMYAGLMLQSLGMEFELFEASDRVGGRIHTWYSTEYNEKKTDEAYRYGEVGGMRLPQFSPDMLPVQQLSLVVNAVLQRNGMDDKMVYWRKFYYDSPVQRLRFNNMKSAITKKDLGVIKPGVANPLGFGTLPGGNVPMVWMTGTAKSKKTKYLDANVPYYPADMVLNVVMTPYIEDLQGKTGKTFDQAFESLMAYDGYSMWGYLTTVFKLKDMGEYYEKEMGHPEANLPFSVASYLETTNVGTGMYSVSFVEIIMAAYDWGGSIDPYRPSDPNIYMLTAFQGMQNLPDACRTVLDLEKGVLESDGETAMIQLGLRAEPGHPKSYNPPNLMPDARPLPPENGPDPVPAKYEPVKVERSKNKKRVYMKHKVLELKYDSKLYSGHGGMKVKVASVAGKNKGTTMDKTYPYVITTLPNGMYLNGDRNVNLLNDISFEKALALRECNYMPSFKAFLTFKEQFWAKLGKRQDAGLGAAATDRPNRQIIYPSYGYEATGGVLQIYCWAEDARRLGALSDEERVNECLKGIAYLYPEVNIDEVFAGYAPEKTTKTWFWDQNAGGGAFALFSPGQFANLYPILLTPEYNGCLNFAGECCSVHHGWIVGALDSAYNAVYNILMRIGDKKKLAQLERTWGDLGAPNTDAPESDAAPKAMLKKQSKAPAKATKKAKAAK